MRAALAIALLAAATLARAEEPPPDDRVGTLPTLQVVRAIDFHGVKALRTSALEARLFTQARPWWKLWGERPPFDEPTLDGDMQRIAATYREFGHYAARATHKVTWDETHTEATIRIDVEEGQAVHLESFSVDLSELPDGAPRWEKLLAEPLPLAKGDVFTVALYGGAKRSLLKRLADVGFPDATLSGGGEVDLATHTATIDWFVHPGPRVRIGEIRISGMETVTDEVIRRELTFEPGDVYSDAEIQESQGKVSDLGLFRSAVIGQVIEPDAPPPEGKPPGKVTRPIAVQVEERPLHSVRVGAGYGTEDKFRAQVGWLHRNVFGRADTFDVRARYSSLTREFQATLKEPHVPDPRTSLWLDSRIREDDLPAYEDAALTGRVAVERPLRRGWSGQVGYDVELVDVRQVTALSPREEERQEGTYRLGYLELGARRITADSLVEPTRGTWLEASVELGASWLGSEKDYLRTTVDGRAFFPIGPTVIAARAMLGSISGLARTPDHDLPVTKLYYAGGSATVRGYDFQEFGPDDLGAEDLGREDDVGRGKAIGGASLLLGSVEWRFPVWRELRGATFVDAGQLSANDYDWQPTNLRFSAGVGLRYSTPLGPIRVDLATPLDRPDGVSRARIWFAIGQPF